MTTTNDAITANIALVEHRLRRAHKLAIDALDAARKNERNLAIGTLLPAEQDIADAAVLLKTALVLHRSPAELEASLP